MTDQPTNPDPVNPDHAAARRNEVCHATIALPVMLSLATFVAVGAVAAIVTIALR